MLRIESPARQSIVGNRTELLVYRLGVPVGQPAVLTLKVTEGAVRHLLHPHLLLVRLLVPASLSTLN